MLPLRFQLLGIACLRIAMVDTRGKLPAPETEAAEEAAADQDPLAPERFAHVSDRTYTTEQVSMRARMGSSLHTQDPLPWPQRASAEVGNSNVTAEQVGILATPSATRSCLC